MTMSYYKKHIVSMFEAAGVTVNGPKPHDIQVHDERFYKRFMRDGRLGIGETYVEGWWDCDDMDAFIYKLHQGQQMIRMKTHNIGFLFTKLLSEIVPAGSLLRSKEIAEAHYDLSNGLFAAFLDPYMQYTCAYWKEGVSELNAAQEAKMDLICRKLQLKPGMHILDVGCGWGGFAKYAAERHGAKVTGVSISKEQLDFARDFCKGLDVDFQFKDYRQISGQFDRIVVAGMFEHVGLKYQRIFMKKMKSALREDGIFLLHTIGCNHSHFNSAWMEKYIFPGCFVPSVKHIGEATEDLFVMEDWHNIGPHYYTTLLAWFNNFDAAWPKLSKKYDERFYRMWKFYLVSQAPGFKARVGQLWQIILTHKGLEDVKASQLRQQ